MHINPSFQALHAEKDPAYVVLLSNKIHDHHRSKRSSFFLPLLFVFVEVACPIAYGSLAFLLERKKQSEFVTHKWTCEFGRCYDIVVSSQSIPTCCIFRMYDEELEYRPSL